VHFNCEGTATVFGEGFESFFDRDINLAAIP